MIYPCSRCGRNFSCEDTISFCPFCGTPYAQPAASIKPTDMRIVIGSDSERTVQEKYWRLSRNALCQALSSLDDLITDEQNLEHFHLDLNEWLRHQKRCRSTIQFKQQCDSFLQRISSALQDSDKEAHISASIDIEQISKTIECSCMQLANVLNQKNIPFKIPALVYEPVSPNQSTDDGKRHIPEAYRQLFQAVEAVKPTLYAILDENGIFVALSVLGNLSPETAAKCRVPALCNQLYEQAEKDYDPLFGEEYDSFVQSFWEAILRLAEIVNHSQELPEPDNNEIAKIEALENYLSAWSDELDTLLDQLYQSQQADMVLVYKHLQQLCSQIDLQQ